MFENREKRTELSELGEFKLIDRLTKNVANRQKSTILGIGDDAAILNFDGKQVLLSTDLLIEGIHFDMSYMPLKHLGYKAVMVNISDIAAMNGTPTQIAVGLAVSNRYSVEALEEIYAGMLLACLKHNIDLVGGDTTSSTSGLMLSITVLGEAAPKDIVRRSTAKSGDLIVVSGDLGAAYTGLLLLEREKEVFAKDPSIQPELDSYPYVLERILRPEARVDMVMRFADMDLIPTSMIDISDGLASEIMHLCEESALGCQLYEDKIPIDPQTVTVAELFNIHPVTCALNGGEDYELLFTVSQNDFEKINGQGEFYIIGHMTETGSPKSLITTSGEAIPLTAQGWDGIKKDDKA
ncbi:MAG: thiamine-phosphate kinase [Bacteroidales bacterium]|jgi:thiamine-monophosphate kinase|nr:thiamine-phosphate kinase [Bacteroidales bacterium]